MRQLRKCETTPFNTGVSKCPPDFSKVIGAILVDPDRKLPADLDAEKLEELVHADGSERVYGIVDFTEYAKNGGEAQTSADGYGPEEFNGFSARKDTFNLRRFNPVLHSNLARTAHMARGVYFFDEENMLYGIDDGTDTLAPFAMSSVYSDAVTHSTSSSRASMTVTFAFEDAKASEIDFDYIKLGFKPSKLTLGLVPVKLVKVDGADNEYRIHEAKGGLDVTAIYAPLLKEAGATVFAVGTACTWDASADKFTITAAASAVARLKSPSVLYEAGIKGIEQVD